MYCSLEADLGKVLVCRDDVGCAQFGTHHPCKLAHAKSGLALSLCEKKHSHVGSCSIDVCVCMCVEGSGQCGFHHMGSRD